MRLRAEQLGGLRCGARPVAVISPTPVSANMREEHRLDLGASDVVAGRNDHIVVARDELKISFIVLAKCIACQVPAVPHIFALTGVGEITATGRSRQAAELFRAEPH